MYENEQFEQEISQWRLLCIQEYESKILFLGLDNRISKESDDLVKLVDGERVERLQSTADIKTSIQNEKEFVLNKLDEEKTVLQNDIAEVRADVEDTKETGNEDIEALKRLLEEEKEAREAGKIFFLMLALLRRASFDHQLWSIFQSSLCRINAPGELTRLY